MAIIQCYGLFWGTDDVYWGQGNNAGALLGVPAAAKSSDPIDFRQQIGIYVLYAGHQIVYIGQAGSGRRKLFARLKEHHRRDDLAGRWDKFSWFGLRRPLNSGKLSVVKLRHSASLSTALNHIEAVLLSAAEPSHNKQSGRWGKEKGVYKYLQHRDDRLGPTQEEMIKEMWGRME